jgi:hypothetical protein
MLIAVSVVSTQHSRLRARWRLEGGPPPLPGQKVPAVAPPPRSPDEPLHWPKEHYRWCGDGELGPSLKVLPDFTGLMLIYEWETGEIVWRSDWNGILLTPYGLAFADDVLYVADLEGPHVFVVDLDKTFGGTTAAHFASRDERSPQSRPNPARLAPVLQRDRCVT